MLTFARMKAYPIKSTLATLQAQCNLSPASLDYWFARVEFHLYHRESVESTLALCTVEFVSNLIVRSLTGARDKKQSKGGNPDAGGLAVPSGLGWREVMETLLAQTNRAKKGKRQPVKISDTDKAEISGIVGWVFSARGVFSRVLTKEDVGECFRIVEGKKGLNLNRRWKACDDSEATLAQLALPTYDFSEEKNRHLALKAKLERCQECIEAAFKQDTNPQRVHRKKKAIAMVSAIVSRTSNGHGKAKITVQQERQWITDYLLQGARALQLGGFNKWTADIITALESLTLKAVSPA